MTARAVKGCTSCGGRLLVSLGGEQAVCPEHPELHDAAGLPSFTVEQVASGGITIDDPAIGGARALALTLAGLLLVGLAGLAILNPATGLLAAVVVAFLIGVAE